MIITEIKSSIKFNLPNLKNAKKIPNRKIGDQYKKYTELFKHKLIIKKINANSHK